MMDDVVPK